MQPSLLLAFSSPAAHWSLILNLLSTRTPRSLSIKLLPSQADFSLCCSSGFYFFRCNTLYLSFLNFIGFYGIHRTPSMKGFLAHSSRQSRSSCRVVSPFLTHFGTTDKLCKGIHLIPSSRSHIKIVSGVEPNIHPLGTPLVTGCLFEKEPFATTQWVLPFSPFPTHGTDHLPRPLYIVLTQC